MTVAASTVLALISGLIASVSLTGVIRAYAIRAKLMDLANHRSMHTEPTPRGGGLAIVVAFFVGLGILAADGVVPHRMALALIVGGLPIAVVGWIDDRRDVSSLVRLAVHIAGCAVALWIYGGEKILPASVPEFIGLPVVAICMAWCVNLYNFMDGLDGFSASEGVFVGLFASILLAGAAPFHLEALTILIAAACLGFLVWNWPPAKIFMGDAGSGFLGFFFAFVAVASLHQSGFFVWPILLSVFVCDATVTLISRILSGERWSEAHNTHAFQLIAKRAGHMRVTIGLWIVNLIVVWPLGYLAATTTLGPWLCGGLVAIEIMAVMLIRNRLGEHRRGAQPAS